MNSPKCHAPMNLDMPVRKGRKAGIIATYRLVQLTMFTLLALLALMISACGSSTDTPRTAVTGAVVAAPIAGAKITVKDGGNVVATATSGADGSYTVNIPTASLANNLVIESTGGAYTDEATGIAGVTGGTLSAYVAGGTLSATASTAYLTPGSTIVKNLVAGGKTLTDANTLFASTFGYTPDTTVKPDMASTATDATQMAAQKLAGFHEAVFSQLVKDQGLPEDHQFDLIDAVSTDLADGTLDGMQGATAILISGHHPMTADFQNKYELAMMNWKANALNTSGLTAADIGNPPFAKTALTASYKVEYVAGTMAAMQGKTTFKIKVSNIATGAAVTGLTPALTAKMYMATMSHTTPVDSVTDNGDGTYTCVVYYLMASGATMGYWELKVALGAETATFYPGVGMSMGDTSKVTLKHSADTYTSMGSTSVRGYPVFKDSLTLMGGMGTLKLFIAAQEGMTSWPALKTGLSLNSAAFTVNTLAVEVSTDGGTVWTAMTEQPTAGHFTLANIAGLTSGTQATFLVRLTINGNVYNNSSTGTAGGTATNYATFKLTPGM
ncbi:MAG: hypothetical protein HZA03_00635 [Nitrospinae bacterium]|nr:hypothetical protein [Nitrospinota bacterium]